MLIFFIVLFKISLMAMRYYYHSALIVSAYHFKNVTQFCLYDLIFLNIYLLSIIFLSLYNHGFARLNTPSLININYDL